MARLGDFSVGRRWRCERSNRISFDFVIIGPGRTKDWVRCRLEPIPGQAAIFGEERVQLFGQDTEQDYTKRHIKRCAQLMPLSLDDFTESITSP